MKKNDLESILAVHTGRREILKAGLAGMLAALPGCAAMGGRGSPAFTPISVSTADKVRVPPGYWVQVLYRWGDPVGSPAGSPEFRGDASNSAEEQALQAGMHHDAIEFFPLPLGSNNSTRALLAINHEYTDDGLLHADGMQNWSAEKVRKSQAAHGVSIIEVQLKD